MNRQISADELAARLGTDSEPFVLDVREPEEVAAWSIPGAVNIPLGDLATRATEIPRDKEVVVVCASGGRSSRATEALTHAGFNARDLIGGMAAWGKVYDTAELNVGNATVVQVRRRGKGCLSYVVGSGDEAFVIDPSVDVDHYLGVAEEHGWHITRVFDTHLHADHLSGARELAAQVGATLHLNPADTFAFDYTPLSDGDRFRLPDDTEMSVCALHTPGHTMGSTIYFINDAAVLTGDTLFVEGVGRPDLADRAEEFARNLYHSLQERVLTLPDHAMVLPGHYGEGVVVLPDEVVGAPLGKLRASLEPLRLDEKHFVAWATERATPRPPNYVEIIKANMGRPETPIELLQQLELGPNRCSAS
ncbi:MAG: rhodanese-like domain-containing protein [Acidimicrobiales bacterium]|nr:rhodanese-like domain-containing protein [Acidimicrobiales bacterium]